MRTSRLLVKRVLEDWKYQISVWRTAIDWIVALYMVVPPLIYGVIKYIAWWHSPPAWLRFLPISFLPAILWLILYRGEIRIFVEEADQLFIVQKTEVLKGLTKLSLLFALTQDLLLVILLFLLIAPWLLLYYKLSFALIALWIMFTWLMKDSLNLVKDLTDLRLQGWLNRIVKTALFLVGELLFRSGTTLLLQQTVLSLVPVLAGLGVTIFLFRQRLNKTGTFFHDVSRGERIKLRYTSLLLQMGSIYGNTFYMKPKRVVTLRSKPLLFPNSTQLFKKRTTANVLAELCLKSVLRNKNLFGNYLTLLVPCLLLLIGLPQYWKWAAWLIFAFILASFVRLYWREMINSQFMQLFRIDNEEKLAGAKKAIFIMMLPGFLLLSLVLGLQTHTWAGAGEAIAGGIIITQIAAHFSAFTA